VPSNESLPDVVRECSLESLEAPTALDEISGNVQGVTDISFPITESTILVWTYEDQEGNKSYQEQQIIIDDTEAPVLDVAELPDLNGECSVIIENIPTATDFCLGSISGVTDIDISQEVKTTQTIVWTFTDSSGNSITQTQKVNIQQDNGAVFDEPELVDIVADCSVIITNIPTASDFCQGQITATANIDINDVIRESTTIIWTYNAGSDNAISQTQEVIIQQNDGFALDEPELADIIAECGTIITSIPTASDFCQGQITAIADIDINEAIRESTTITWTYDTGTDNPLSQTQKVIITDNQEPTVNDEDFQVLTGEFNTRYT